MGLLHEARLAARRFGLELSRYHPELDFAAQIMSQLKSHTVNIVLDVGANSGQYACELRRAGFRGRIVSFEPLSEPYTALKAKASTDSLWDCHRCAVGDLDGTISVNVAGNGGQSSSVLPMLTSHREAFPEANYVGVEDVPVHKLDSLAPRLLQSGDIGFLKIDVQGYEKGVLSGAEETVRNHCVGMQLELSLLPLYENSMLIREALDLAQSMGFTLTGLQPVVTDVRTGRLLQVDGIFFRDTL